MPRRVTPFLPDQYFHLYNRGNNRQTIFFKRNNYVYFLRGIKKYLCEVMDILVYCLMPTHYHMLARVRPQAAASSRSSKATMDGEPWEVSGGSGGGEEVSKAVSLAMQKISISYTKAVNKRFERVGALFQGQFQSKPIQKSNHLLNLCIYIHANPVKGGLAASPEDWEFSNYLEWIKLREGTLVDREFIVDNFGTPDEYKNLVMETIKTRNLPDDLSKYLQDLEG